MPGTLWKLEQNDELVTIRTPAVRIVFRRAADRWSHEVGPDDGPARVASLESEADPADASRVLSPVYQEVQHHAFDDDERRVRLLLTGLLDRHHFSAVLTVSVDEGGATTIDFDVADRCREPVASLAATYDVSLGAGELFQADGTSVRWAGGPLGEAELAMVAADGASLALAERGPRAVQAQVLASLAPGAFTHRLRYRWTWAVRSGRTR